MTVLKDPTRQEDMQVLSVINKYLLKQIVENKHEMWKSGAPIYDLTTCQVCPAETCRVTNLHYENLLFFFCLCVFFTRLCYFFFNGFECIIK